MNKIKTFVLKGELRPSTGKKLSKQLRKEARSTAVLYRGKEAPIHFSLHMWDIEKLVNTSNVYLIDLVLQKDERYFCQLKKIAEHPVSRMILDAEFYQIRPDAKVTFSVPIKFIGTSEGEKEGGRLFPKLRYLKIKGSIEEIPESISVDIKDLALGTTLRVKDLNSNKAYEVLHNDTLPICTIEITRALRSKISQESK